MAKHQQVVITIGHLSLLLPDDTGVATVVKTLSKGLPCFYYPGAREVELRKEELTVSMSYVSPSTPVTVEGGGSAEPRKGRKARTLALKPPPLLALMDGGE